MSQIKLTSFVFACTACILFLLSCSKDQDENNMIYTNGAFITCEGNFNSGDASVSYYSTITDSIYNNVFYQVNDRNVGDVLQSATIHNGNIYLIVNNSGKVEIVDSATFQGKGVITDVPTPRYMVTNGNTGYISCWGDNSVKIVDLVTHEITGSVAASSGPDKMVIQNNKLYILNSGGWGVDSTITVVNVNTNEVTGSIEVKYTPTDLVVDPQGDIWVLCFGKIIYGTEDPYPILEETASKLYRIDTETDRVTEEETLFEDQHPMHLEIDNAGVLYIGGGYTFDGIWSIQEDMLPGSRNKIISGDYAYGFNIDPNTNVLYLTFAPSYTSPGIIKRYTANGTLLGEYECGIGPNGVVFTMP